MTGLLQRWMARATRPPLHFEFFHQQQILTTNLFTSTLLSLTVRMPIPICRIRGLNLPVTMIVDPLFSSLKTNLEIGACTEDGAVACHDDGAYSVVDVDEGEEALELLRHHPREGIVLARTMKRHNDDGSR